MRHASSQTTPTHYHVLAFPPPSPHTTPPSPSRLKSAYRDALLANHPDKAPRLLQSQGSDGEPRGEPRGAELAAPTDDQNPTWSIDQITTAYRILSDPVSRREYDDALLADRRWSRMDGDEGRTDGVSTTELEVLDLDDMQFDEEKNVWRRECRCGSGEGFEVGEAELLEGLGERDARGEVLLGCAGCSHHVKVVFGVEGLEGG